MFKPPSVDCAALWASLPARAGVVANIRQAKENMYMHVHPLCVCVCIVMMSPSCIPFDLVFVIIFCRPRPAREAFFWLGRFSRLGLRSGSW